MGKMTKKAGGQSIKKREESKNGIGGKRRKTEGKGWLKTRNERQESMGRKRMKEEKEREREIQEKMTEWEGE